MRNTRLLLSIAVIFSLVTQAAEAAAPTAPTTFPDESGDYYDWTITKKPERPWLHEYDQMYIGKLFLGAKEPGENCKVYLTFEQALDVIKRADAITCGVPKIIFLVGWQYNGHDSKYPAWHEVNVRLKRPQDATATDSLKWLMNEALKYHTIISLHINMFDAYQDSPLWAEYVAKDVIAKDKQGNPLPGPMWPPNGGDELEDRSFQISHAREWETGLAQKRIDDLLAMLPIQKAGVIHIDAFHTIVPKRVDPQRISPFLDYPPDKEAAAQRKIYRYFRDKGIDLTSEMSSQWRIDPFIGLQPWAMNFKPLGKDVPPSLYCGEPVNLEAIAKNNPDKLPGLLPQFCMQAIPWLFYNRHWTAATTTPADMESWIDQPRFETIGGVQMPTGDDLCMPATWRNDLMIAFSKLGYAQHTWPVPADWKDVHHAKISEITMDGPKLIGEIPVNHHITLSLKAGQGVTIEAE